MIRGPVLPQLRDSLWSLVSSRLDRIETGLTLVLESLDCSDGELGPVEGLARDSAGGAVLILLAVEGDALLPARALSAGQFLERVGDALVRAVPEANFCPGMPGRVLLIGTEAAAGALQSVCSLPIRGLHACALEPFRIAGTERFAVRWLDTLGHQAAALQSAPVSQPAAMPQATDVAPESVDGGALVDRALRPEFVVPPARAELWEDLLSICERIDSAVVVHGDRFSRTISWNGFTLGEVRAVGGSLVASSATGSSPTGVVRDLRDRRDVRRFGDQLLRAYVRHAELDLVGLDLARPAHEQGAAASEPSTNSDQFSSRSAASSDSNGRLAATRHAVGDRRGLPNGERPVGESLRSSLAASKLSPEEYSALGDPASSAGPFIEGSVANDRS